MPKGMEPAGECRSSMWMLRELARRMDVPDFFPWSDDAGPLDAILDHPRAGHATVAALIAEGGQRALNISHVGHSDLEFSDALRRSRALLGARGGARPAGAADVPAASDLGVSAAVPSGPHACTHFHAFYDHGRALPSLAAADPEPLLWMSPHDATARRNRRPRADPDVERAGRDAGARARDGAGPLRARCGCATGGKG